MIIGDASWQQYFEWMSILSAPSTPIRQSWNVAPTTINPIFIQSPEGLVGEMARWGLVPEWFKKPIKELKFNTFNARLEEATEKPTYRDAMRHGHCMVPAKGYYEWTGEKGAKTPYYISVQTNAPGFCMAGLYTQVSLPDFEGFSYSILTEASSGPLKNLHQRMPVMLAQSAYKGWMAGEPLANLPRIDPSQINFHEVGKAVGNVRNEGAELIAPTGQSTLNI